MVLESVNLLAEHKSGILEYLANNQVDIKGFNQEQVEEEIKKSRIMIKNDTFKCAIMDAEKSMEYFSGQIRSAIYFSELEEKQDIKLFELCVEKINRLIENKILLRRALLCMGDYRLDINSYKTLCIDDPNERSRTYSLKRLFSQNGLFIKKLINVINNTESVEEQLNIIISKSKILQNDWRYCLINYVELFEKMSNNHLRMCNNGKEELLIRNKQSNGINYSLYLEALKINLNNTGIIEGINEFSDFGAYGDRYIVIENHKIRFKNMS